MYHSAILVGIDWAKKVIDNNEESKEHMTNESKLMWNTYKDFIRNSLIEILGEESKSVVFVKVFNSESSHHGYVTICEKQAIRVEVGKFETRAINVPLVLKNNEWKVDLIKLVG